MKDCGKIAAELCTEKKMQRPKSRTTICKRWLWPGMDLLTAKLDGFFSSNADHNLMACLGMWAGNKRKRFEQLNNLLLFNRPLSVI